MAKPGTHPEKSPVTPVCPDSKVDAGSQIQWRAGLPRVGLRSSPTTGAEFYQQISVPLLELLCNPARGKPARHKPYPLNVVVFLVGFQRLEPLALERLAQRRSLDAFLP